ncbi:MAG: hypothetical protein PQJ44_05225 [Sphaerochaetaceae bacterium]|nr:hypothetical protein [Sphaerochaetaceae bacterium]
MLHSRYMTPVMFTDSTGFAPEWLRDIVAGVVVTVIVAALIVAAISTGGAAGIVMMSVAGGMGFGALNEASIAIENGTSIAAGIYGGALKGGAQGLAVGLGVITGAGLISSGWGIIAFGASLAFNYGTGYGKYGIDCHYNGYDYNPDNAYTMGMKQMVSSIFAFGTGFLIGASGFYSTPGQKLSLENQIGYKAVEYLFKGIYYLPIDYTIQMM